MAFFGLRAKRWATLACAASLSFACSNLIGISSYEIDPSLDPQGTGGEGPSGGKASGGKASGGSSSDGGSNNPSGGEPSVGGDQSSGGEPSVGGQPNAGAGQGGAPEPMAGAGGMGPEPECRVTPDCDDAIDCTTDTCTPMGVCTHIPKDTLCDESMCETCQLGLGCVAGTPVTQQLLIDPGFDLASMDWDQSTSDTPNLLADAAAQTPPRSAKFGPAAAMAMAQQYSDVYQWVTIPDGTVALNLKGYYKLKPGTKAPADDSVMIAFYESGATTSYAQLHDFIAKGDTQAAWKAFTYSVPTSTAKKMGGNEYTFDFVGYVWDSVYRFDSLQLNATVCQ